jgi:hypothetical protein
MMATAWPTAMTSSLSSVQDYLKEIFANSASGIFGQYRCHRFGGGNTPEADGARARIYEGDSTLARRDVQSRPATSPPTPGGTTEPLPADQQ